MPKFLSIFHDTVVASATLMLVFFGTILFILGPDILSNAKVITSGTLYVPENNHSLCSLFKRHSRSLFTYLC